eukprot:44754-Chlamydomonas_euryale.AAC.4
MVRLPVPVDSGACKLDLTPRWFQHGCFTDKERSPPDSTTSPAAQGYIDAGPHTSLVPTRMPPGTHRVSRLGAAWAQQGGRIPCA